MDKKKALFCLIILFVAIPAFLVITNSKKDDYNLNNNNYEKAQQIEEFTSKEEGTDPKVDITTNEGGYTGIFIKNKQSLLKVMNTDGMLSVNDMINEALKYIPKIHEDSKYLEGGDINKYYDDNKSKISYTFGINDPETFAKFLSDLNFLGVEGTINDVSIDPNSITKGEFNVDEVRFNLILKSTIGKSQTFNIKFPIQENNQKDSKIIYWY